MSTQPPVEVVAAAITDPRGRILLARRTAGRDLAGLWEFPGGKREPGETPEQALIRELDEELGIQVQVGSPLIAVPQAYPHRRMRLDVRRVSAWKGIPKGHEGQALAWVPPHRLASYAMPPADIPVVAALTQPDRYLVTPAPGEHTVADRRSRERGFPPSPTASAPDRRPRERGDPASYLPFPTPRHSRAGGSPWTLGPTGAESEDAAWLAGIERALATGIRRLHLRLPHTFRHDRRTALFTRAVALIHAAGAEALIGGDIELARATGAGVHLRAAQLAGLHERPLPRTLLVAASCHDEAELHHAQRLGCDFAVLGPVQPTPTHPEAPGLGWTRFAALRETVSLPIYAIGGLAPADIPKARQHGAQGIAAIRALWPE